MNGVLSGSTKSRERMLWWREWSVATNKKVMEIGKEKGGAE